MRFPIFAFTLIASCCAHEPVIQPEPHPDAGIDPCANIDDGDPCTEDVCDIDTDPDGTPVVHIAHWPIEGCVPTSN